MYDENIFVAPNYTFAIIMWRNRTAQEALSNCINAKLQLMCEDLFALKTDCCIAGIRKAWVIPSIWRNPAPGVGWTSNLMLSSRLQLECNAECDCCTKVTLAMLTPEIVAEGAQLVQCACKCEYRVDESVQASLLAARKRLFVCLFVCYRIVNLMYMFNV
jgi:hypothetical protein